MNNYSAFFGFREWPFRIVVDDTFAKVWADREEVRRSIDTRMRRMVALPNSTVQLIWADFGAGKSHTLRHIESRCGHGSEESLVGVYTEVSVGLESLLGLYRSFAAALPSEVLEAAGSAVVSSGLAVPRAQGGRDLWQALRLIRSGNFDAGAVGREWLAAPARLPHQNVLKANGISGRIEDEARLVEVIVELVRILRTVKPTAALVWLIDEFQRTAAMPAKKRDGLAKALVSLFNACSAGLHLVLSFSVAQQDAALQLLPPDLQSRARAFPMLSLPYLDTGNAELFVKELFDAFRAGEVRNDEPYMPLSRAGLGMIASQSHKATSGRLTPRVLMETLSAIFLDIYDRNEGSAVELPIDSAQVATALESLDKSGWSAVSS
jgi:hypothetical protein